MVDGEEEHVARTSISLSWSSRTSATARSSSSPGAWNEKRSCRSVGADSASLRLLATSAGTGLRGSKSNAGSSSVSLVLLLVSGRASTLTGILLGFLEAGDEEEEEVLRLSGMICSLWGMSSSTIGWKFGYMDIMRRCRISRDKRALIVYLVEVLLV